ncbi:hypothetical protein [Lentilitoribacter sp. EG35]|uniref:hypothetical protein n=1 Tax=Lentilitoribacter sp. EG35 TaxID=3234192 RepID=UPI00346036B2
MTDKNVKLSEQDAKKKRLAQQLRANLKRRKSQTRASRSGKADQTNGLPAAHLDDGEN